MQDHLRPPKRVFLPQRTGNQPKTQQETQKPCSVEATDRQPVRCTQWLGCGAQSKGGVEGAVVFCTVRRHAVCQDGCPAESWSQTLPVQPSQHERNFATFLFTVVEAVNTHQFARGSFHSEFHLTIIVIETQMLKTFAHRCTAIPALESRSVSVGHKAFGSRSLAA